MQVFWEIDFRSPTILTAPPALVLNICSVAKTGFTSKKLPEDTGAAQLEGTWAALHTAATSTGTGKG